MRELSPSDIIYDCVGSVKKLLGLITLLHCPKCGSDEWRQQDIYYKISKVYVNDKGCHMHSEEEEYQYDYTNFYCGTCDYSE